MPKLLFLVTEDWYFVSHRMALAVLAREEGFDVVVATRCAQHVQLIEDAGIRVLDFSLTRRSTHPWTLFKEILKTRKLFAQIRPDIIHNVALKPVVVGGVAARTLGVRNVVSAVAGLGFLFAGQDRATRAKRLLKRILPFAVGSGIAIVQNPEDQAELRSFGIVQSKIRLIPGAGVDVSSFQRTPEPSGVPVVMLASRLLWDKGVGEFVNVARRLKEQGEQARFVLVGDPDPDNPVSVPQADIDKWVGEGTIEWWGRRADMPSTLSAASLICLPSYREGMPKVLLEAMAVGRACVTTDAPGCRDAVQHGFNGLLVPVKDVAALGDSIKQLLDSPDLRREMGENGRRRAETEFSQEIINHATVQVYREMCP